jgi:hypothetical protein
MEILLKLSIYSIERPVKHLNREKNRTFNNISLTIKKQEDLHLKTKSLNRVKSLALEYSLKKKTAKSSVS